MHTDKENNMTDKLNTRDISALLHHGQHDLIRLLKKLSDAKAVYETKGVFKPLVSLETHAARPAFYVDNNKDALLALENAYRQEKGICETDRAQLLSAQELARVLGKNRKSILEALIRLSQNNATYQVGDEVRPLVMRAKSERSRVGHVIDNCPEAVEAVRQSFAESRFPKRVPVDQFLKAADVTKEFGIPLRDSYSFLHRAYKHCMTYFKGGEEQPLVEQFKTASRPALVLPRNPEAMAEFSHLIHPYLRESAVISAMDERPIVTKRLLMHLYEQKNTYNYHGEQVPLVCCYSGRQKRKLYGLDSRPEAMAMFKEKMVEFKKVPVNNMYAGGVIVENLLKNTSLTLEDLAALGRGFKTRVSAVRSMAAGWVKIGVPEHRLYAQIQPTVEKPTWDPILARKVGIYNLKKWRKQVLGLMSILAVVEMCKKQGTDFRTILGTNPLKAPVFPIGKDPTDRTL